MKVLFFGTPQTAVPFLEWLSRNTELVGVVCRPDEPVGRGLKLTPPPAKAFAASKNIPVFQPEGPWTDAQLNDFKKLGADVGIAVAYGRLLPENIFLAPRLGTFNVHFSLLPQYRGAAPMQWALINGETSTGVSVFWLEKGLDSGPLLDRQRVDISPEDDLISLRSKLIDAGVRVMERVMGELAAGRIVRQAQTGEASLAPQLKKEDGRIDWTWPASRIVNLVRGVREWPGAVTTMTVAGGPARMLKILSARAETGDGKEPGSIVGAEKDGFVVQAGQGRVRVLIVQPEGKKEMSAPDFWRGARLAKGDRLG